MTYDPAPLLAAAEAIVMRCERHPMSVAVSPDTATANELAGLLDVATRTVTRWRNGGSVAEWMADRLATTVGEHPGVLWPEWWDAVTVPCANDRCNERFPKGGKRRFCSRRCQNATSGRSRYAVPEVAERVKARRRSYYETCGDYERARNNRRRAEARKVAS